MLFVPYEKYRIKTSQSINTANGIDVIEQVHLGGYSQWISIRGADKNNPVLLYLHGGPGGASLPLLRHFNRALEEHFTIVTWEQRGAGKSYSPHLTAEDMTIELFVEDAIELTHQLIQRFPEEKIFLCGHSWGTILGMKAIQHAPDLYHAYVGIAQVVNPPAGELISYAFAMNAAVADNNHEAISDLTSIGPPPYDLDDDFWVKLTTQRKWLFYYGGSVFARETLYPATLHLFAPEYSLQDFFNLRTANQFSVSMLWEELIAVDLAQEIKTVEIPVYFFVGRHDHVTPAQLAAAYAEELRAPSVELFWFESSAHSPHFEESLLFNTLLVDTLLTADH